MRTAHHGGRSEIVKHASKGPPLPGAYRTLARSFSAQEPSTRRTESLQESPPPGFIRIAPLGRKLERSCVVYMY